MKSATGIPRLALMANCQNQDGILVSLKAIKRNITGLAARDNQFPQIQFDWAAHQWMTLQYGNSLFDQFKRFRRCQRISLQQEIGQPFEVEQRNLRID